MRPTSNTTTASVDGGFRKWSSPVPCLFGGLALMLGLIALALLILACSYRKSPSSSSLSSSSSSSRSLSHSMAQNAEEKATAKRLEAADDEPKIVVIMAGDENPTYLAKPVVSSSH